MSNNFIPEHHNFTVEYNGIKRVIDSPCQLGAPIFGDSIPKDYKFLNLKAIWDTGATGSVITVRAAKELGLVPTSKTIVQGVNSRDVKNVYAVSISLPNKVTIPFVNVTECNDLSADYDVLIGMDIMSHGDLAITHSNGQTVFTFRIPSIARIDFTHPENNKNVTGHPPQQNFGDKVSALRRNQGISNKKRRK